MDTGEEHRCGQAMVSQLVAMRVRDLSDEAVAAQSAQVVGHLPGGDGLRGQTAELSGEAPQVLVGEPVWLQPEFEQRGEQRVAALLTHPQPGYPDPGVGDNRVGDGVQVTGTGDRVVVESLDAEQATVGAQADLPQGGQIPQTLPDREIHAVVDRCLGPQGTSLAGYAGRIAAHGPPQNRTGTLPRIRLKQAPKALGQGRSARSVPWRCGSRGIGRARDEGCWSRPTRRAAGKSGSACAGPCRWREPTVPIRWGFVVDGRRAGAGPDTTDNAQPAAARAAG